MSTNGTPPSARPDFWIGYLAMGISIALRLDGPKEARADLKRTLDAFLRSPVPSRELRRRLTTD